MFCLKIGQTAPGVIIIGMDAAGVFPLDSAMTLVGRSLECQIVIKHACVGGYRNFWITAAPDGTCRIQHGGHAISVLLNGVALQEGGSILSPGDFIEPIDADTGLPAVRFLVVEAEAEPPASDAGALREESVPDRTPAHSVAPDSASLETLAAADRRRSLLYMFQQISLPEAVFQNHPELMRELAGESRSMPLLHFRSKAQVRCLQSGMIDAGMDEEALVEYSIELFKDVAVHQHHRNGYTVHVVTMPRPLIATEAYFAAIVHQDDEPKPHMQVAPSTRYFLLEKAAMQLVMLCERRADGSHLNLGVGPPPEMSAFVDAVFACLDKQSPVPLAEQCDHHAINVDLLDLLCELEADTKSATGEKSDSAPAATSESGPACLEPKDGGLCIPLTDWGLWFGRTRETQVFFEDTGVSREHAKIELTADGGCRLSDHSSNGTLVNGPRITEPVLLRHGDVIRIQDSEFRFMRVSAEAHASAVVAWERAMSAPHWLVHATFHYLTNRVLEEMGGYMVCIPRWCERCKELLKAHQLSPNNFWSEDFYIAIPDSPGVEPRIAALVRDLAALSKTGDPALRTIVHLGMADKRSYRGKGMKYFYRVAKINRSYDTKVVVTELAARRLKDVFELTALPPLPLYEHLGVHQWFYIEDGSTPCQPHTYGPPMLRLPYRLNFETSPSRRRLRAFMVSTCLVGLLGYAGVHQSWLAEIPWLDPSHYMLVGVLCRLLVVVCAFLAVFFALASVMAWLGSQVRKRAALEVTAWAITVRRGFPMLKTIQIPYVDMVRVDEEAVPGSTPPHTVLHVITPDRRVEISSHIFPDLAAFHLFREYLHSRVAQDG